MSDAGVVGAEEAVKVIRDHRPLEDAIVVQVNGTARGFGDAVAVDVDQATDRLTDPIVVNVQFEVIAERVNRVGQVETPVDHFASFNPSRTLNYAVAGGRL